MELHHTVTRWLKEWRAGDDVAIERVTALVYRDLRRLASHHLSTEREGHTLQATALVHEAYLHIESLREIDWKERSQFIAVMAQMMRRVLIDYARRRSAAKRTRVDDPGVLCIDSPSLNVLAIDQVLTRMSVRYPRHAQAVELRFFGGLDAPEIARVLNVSLGTVERDWRFARAWLQTEISRSAKPAGSSG